MFHSVKNLIGKIMAWPSLLKLQTTIKDHGIISSEQVVQLLNDIELYKSEGKLNTLLWQQAKFHELQSQINPHFLYNTLESIRGQAIGDGNHKIAEMTEALAKYFRYTINKESDMVTLKQEIESVTNYVRIQKYRFEDRFEFFSYFDDVTSLECEIPKMCLQPIVENAIYHGLEARISGGLIDIRVEGTLDKVRIIVQDNGQGIEEDKLRFLQEQLQDPKVITERDTMKHHMGIALQNVNHRLKLLFGDDYGVFLTSRRNYGTEVVIEIPRSGD